MCALVAFATLAGACGIERSGYQFVRSRSTGTYLKVPDDWTVHSQADLTDAFAAEGIAPNENPVPFLTVFDAEPDAPVDAFDIARDRPMGLLRVRDLSDGERDQVSFASARDELFGLNAGIESGQVPIRKAVDVQQDSADGQRLVFTLTDEETSTTSTIDQTTLIDQDKRRVYVLLVACEASCYQKHRKQIEAVVTSLTIKET
jgi:hypothetical protein